MRFDQSFLCAVGILVAAASLADETQRYDWLTAGKVSGSHVRIIRDDGTRVTDFEFNDRGRGPKLHEELKTSKDGMLVSLQVSGHSYMGAPVDETFSVEDGVARWKSNLEQGEAQAGAFYWANEGTLEQLAMLARALLATASGQADVLPAGKASIRKVAGHDNVVLYAISGLDLTPQYIWLDQDGELFALAMGWMGLVPQGKSGILPVLQEIQDREEKSYHRKLAQTLTSHLPANWIIRNVSVVDVENGTLKQDQLVAVTNGRIVRVVEDKGLDLPVYGDMQPKIIDGQGLTLIPGLWDMHTHMSLEDGLLQIAAGVTNVRDMGNDPERLLEIRAAFDDGEVIGPHSTAVGFIDGKSPYSAPTQSLAGSLDEALVMVREYAASGVPQIKIYSSIDPSYAMIADHMPPSIRRSMLAGEMDINNNNAARYARSADALLDMIAKLHAAGVPMVAGTDAMAGFTLHRELELYHRAGISNSDVLKIATLDSARIAGKAVDGGSISVGKRADFVLLAGNPLDDISAVRRPVAVFKGDRWFDTALLYEAIGIRPFTR